MCTIKLIALDLDGTLLSSDKTISARNHAAIRRAVEARITVVLASGRMHSSTVQYALQLDLPKDTPVLSYNGAMCRTVGGETLFEYPLEAQSAAWVVGFCKENRRHLNYYLRDTLYTAEPDQWVEFYYGRTGCRATVVGDLAKFDGERPTKVIIIDQPGEIDALLPIATAHFGDAATVLKTDDEYIEFMSPEAGKGAGLERVAALLGIAEADCLAMGDNYNDLSMLQWAGHGYVMSSGRREMLNMVPNHAPAAEDDGVAAVIESLQP